MESKKISDGKIYFLSIIHIVRILIMTFFFICPVLFFFISAYLLFELEWIKAVVYSILGISIHFCYPIVLSWFEEGRTKFKNTVDEWSSQLDKSIK